jgi:hypothetical protein
MNANELNSYLEAEFGRTLKCERGTGRYAYFWHEIKRAPKSTRLIRISESISGEVVEIKLAQSSIAEGKDVLLLVPASPEKIASTIRAELAQLLAK